MYVITVEKKTIYSAVREDLNLIALGGYDSENNDCYKFACSYEKLTDLLIINSMIIAFLKECGFSRDTPIPHDALIDDLSFSSETTIFICRKDLKLNKFNELKKYFKLEIERNQRI